MQHTEMPNLEYLRSVLDYNPETGDFRWKKNAGTRAKIGDIACKKIDANGYYVIGLDSKLYKAHRLAYYISYGIEPTGFEVDHINQIRHDNKICNLRLATRSQNQRNVKTRKTSSTGYKCIQLRTDPEGYSFYHIRVSFNGKRYAKRISSIIPNALQQAIQYRDNLIKELHGDFANLG